MDWRDVAKAPIFYYGHLIEKSGMAVTALLFELIARLQALATVPMIDTRAYAAWSKA